ncbi:hypothetical protein [Streptomyces shaanxiensis]|uniref:Uncharacterized protein n=1 Tax=Streptomyces shaanxiensis TaxID=653357 RepID=A0ABP7UE36_9ACTN
MSWTIERRGGMTSDRARRAHRRYWQQFKVSPAARPAQGLRRALGGGLPFPRVWPTAARAEVAASETT